MSTKYKYNHSSIIILKMAHENHWASLTLDKLGMCALLNRARWKMPLIDTSYSSI